MIWTHGLDLYWSNIILVIAVQVSVGKKTWYLSITMKIFLTSRTPWKGLRDLQGITVMTTVLNSFPLHFPPYACEQSR